ncbi:Fc receptor-like protein 5 [Rhinophrynus dorsalis]
MHCVYTWCFYISLCALGELNLYEAALGTPSISFSNDYATYVVGESVTLLCQIPAPLLVHSYQFFMNDQELQRMDGPSGKQLTLRNVNIGNAGSYSCIYWVADTWKKQRSSPSPPVFLSVIDQPSRPSLLIKPKQALYFEGESVSLICDHSHVTTSLGGYIFQKDNSKLEGHRDALRSEYSILSLSTKDSGTYDCQYWLAGHHRKVYSSWSMPQTVDVTALSTSPLLNSLPPYSTFIKGETLTLDCVAPAPIPVSLYRFYKDGRELVSPSTTYTAQYILQNVTKENNGTYTCMYWSTKSQREIPSIESVTKELYVIDPLLPPLLSLDPPSGRIWNGGNVTLFCTTPIHYEQTTFHFLNERNEILGISPNRTQMRTAITITMSKTNTTSTKKFFCQYSAFLKGRWLLSPKSHLSEIIVIKGSLLWLIAIGVAAAVAVLIIIFLLLYWVLLARKDSSEVATKCQSASEDDGKFITLRSEDDC